MAQKAFKSNEKLAESIKQRRLELNLTIEEAAQRAGVGTKTWCRYESGESIRHDKCKGVCRALNWQGFPNGNIDDNEIFDYEEYTSHKAWSSSIKKQFGDIAAISFVIGTDILLDYLREDLQEMSTMPKGSHIGQVNISWIASLLPQQFLTRYDYEFLYHLYVTVRRLRTVAHNYKKFIVHSVMEELAVYLIVEASELLVESMWENMEDAGLDCEEYWKDWIYDLFGDCDLITCLYSDFYMTRDNIYHFDHWSENQFWTEETLE